MTQLTPPTPQRIFQTPAKRLGKHLRTALVAGVITAIPLFVTLYIIQFIYNLVTLYSQTPADKFFLLVIRPFLAGTNSQTLIELVRWITVSVLALVFSLTIVYLLGLLGTFVFGKRLLEAFEHFIENLPLIKGIYGSAKQVIGVFSTGPGGSGFQRVVLLEFPRKDMWSIAFVTNTITDTTSGRKMACVFIPMTPNPTSGFFQIVPAAELCDTDWSVDQGIKIVLSGGLLAPPTFPFTCANRHTTPITPAPSDPSQK